MRLLVLAGGFGTRLKSAVPDVPKALAPIGEVPFLKLQIQNWWTQGLRHFTFLLHHQADAIIDFLMAEQQAFSRDCQIDWLIESSPMDTGGAVAHAVKTFGLDGSFLVTNADTWLGGGVLDMINSSSPSMAVVRRTDVNRYGQVNFDDDMRVKFFAEKNVGTAEGWINAGLYHLSADLFTRWDGHPFSLERDFFATLVQSRILSVVQLETDFIDIGVPADYNRYCRWVASGREDFPCN